MLDIKGNASTDLLVANAGNGVFKLLHAVSGTFEVVETFVQTATPHLSDLALVATGSVLEVYGTDAGRETAVLLGTFGAGAVIPPFLPQGPGFVTPPEIAGDVSPTIAKDTNAPFFLAAAGTIVENGSFEPAFAGGVNLANVSITVGWEEVDMHQAGPTTGPLGSPNSGATANGILLLNLSDPDVTPTIPNDAGDQAKLDQYFSEFAARADSAATTTAFSLEGKAIVQTSIDSLWQDLGEDLA